VPHEAWFEKHRGHFYQFTRYLLERRGEFVQTVKHFLDAWSEQPGLTQRTKTAFGIPYAAFTAMAVMLESHTGDELMEFRKHTVESASAAAADVSAETNVNVFLSDMITAWKAGEINPDAFRLHWTTSEAPPGAPGQGRWNSYDLYLDPDAVLSSVQLFLSKQRSTSGLKRKDLRDQLSREPYWINGRHDLRFIHSSKQYVAKAWGLRIDLMPEPFGYQRITQEQYEHYLTHAGDEMRADPRKGDIFAIVDAMRDKELGSRREIE
jgi:hypothetical protein